RRTRRRTVPVETSPPSIQPLKASTSVASCSAGQAWTRNSSSGPSFIPRLYLAHVAGGNDPPLILPVEIAGTQEESPHHSPDTTPSAPGVSAATATGGADRTRRGRPRRTVQPGPGYRGVAGPRAGRAEAGG